MSTLYVALASFMLVLLGPLLANTGAVTPLVGFGIYAGSGVVALVAIVWAVIRWRRRGALRELNAAGIAAPAFLLTTVPFAWSMIQGYPRINDVSTDPADPPRFVVAEDSDYGDDLARTVAAAYPDADTLVLEAGFEEVIAAVRALIVDRGWELVHQSEGGGVAVVEAVAETWLFRFRDDIVVRVRAESETATAVDMRSRSRAGEGDLGANAARIVSFLGDLAERVAP